MQDYNQFVTAINKIFDYLTKLRAGWNNQDNFNYIDAIEEFKTAITNNAEVFKQPRRELDPEELKELEERKAAEEAEEAAKEAEKAKHAQEAVPEQQAPQQQEPQTATAPQPEALPTTPAEQQPVATTEPATEAAPIETLSETPIESLGDDNPPIETLSQEPQPETTQESSIIETTDNEAIQTTEPTTLAIPQINQPAESAPEAIESIKSVEGETAIEESLVIAPPPIPNLVGATEEAQS